MEDVVLLLYMKDEDYGRRLLRFLLRQKNPRLHPELVTSEHLVQDRVGTPTQKLWVLTDRDEVAEDGKKEVIYLSNEQDARGKKIFQFQKAEKIYQELLRFLPEDLSGQRAAMAEAEEAVKGIYGVFSPAGRGAALLSAMLSQYLGGRGRCLYISVVGFPLYYGENLSDEPDFSGRGIGDLLFSLEQRDFAEREEKMRRPFGRAHMLLPVPHFKDLLDCGGEEWGRFLQRLVTDCGYDSIVVEFGQISEYLLDFMERCDRIYVPEYDDGAGAVRRKVWEHYCAVENREDLPKKMKCVKTGDEFMDWEKELFREGVSALGDDAGKMDFVDRMMRGGERDEWIRFDSE